MPGVAAGAGVRRIVYVSSMLALFPPRGETMTADDPVTGPRSMYAATKASAERLARALQDAAPITIVYPAAVQGPDDPTFSVGPRLVAGALRHRTVLVTEGGLAYSDARDLAALFVAIFEEKTTKTRLIAPSFYVPHAEYHALLEKLAGRPLKAQRMPGWLLRGMGRLGDLAQRLRLAKNVQLTSEAAEVLTRSVPLEDTEARRLLGRPAIEAEQSFADLARWMVASGHLDAEAVEGLRPA